MSPPRARAVLDASGALASEGPAGAVVWWSVTKPAIAAAALRLVAQRRLALDAPLAGEAFTLRQLLAHRAGLGDCGPLPAYREAVARGDPPWTFAEMRARIEAAHPPRPPGSPFAYSNLGYALVGRLVTEASGLPLGAALAELVLDPLGVTDARFAETDADLAATVFPPPAGYHPGHVHHGVLVGPAASAARVVRGIADGAALPPDLAAAMRAPEPVETGPLPGRPWAEPGYGLGLMAGVTADPRTGARLSVLGHSAGGPGSVGAVYHAPATGRTAAVFAPGLDEGAVEHAALAALLDGA
ncbi:serine hydrolase domain-containing protein [Salinarimonas sp.]|uniref:serine hydrolase domain-containing protein n=1 Tax=Salinarimonas sp. TaxID=2766526 RepID=UPI0032D95214